MAGSRESYWILDDEGNPMRFVGTLATWAEWVNANAERIRIGDTRIRRFRVSTIFAGPHFETMIFGPKASGLDLYAVKSNTRAEAEEQHARAVALVRSKL